MQFRGLLDKPMSLLPSIKLYSVKKANDAKECLKSSCNCVGVSVGAPKDIREDELLPKRSGCFCLLAKIMYGEFYRGYAK